MPFLLRPMRVSDVDACALLPTTDEAAYDAPTRALRPRLWRELLMNGHCGAMVVEDSSLPPGRNIVAWGMVVFLADDFMDVALRPDALPYINRRIVDAWHAGYSPLLGRDAVARANSGAGVNLHIFHEWFPPPSPEVTAEERTLLDLAIVGFLANVKGYRLRQTTIEVYGQDHVQFNLNGGYQPRTDYAVFYRRHPEQCPPAERHPYLLGMNSEEARLSHGSSLGTIFAYTPPCIFFSPAEQDVLKAALRDLTDEEVAVEIGLSPASVRKRWLGIYDRAEMTLPELLPTGTDKVRGAEKKRRLLAYLRSHPEELRPHLPPK